MEAKLFLTQDNFDMAPIAKGVTRWEIEKQEYDFMKATDNSRLMLKVSLSPPVYCTFKASQQNCDYLKEILLKYFVPNMQLEPLANSQDPSTLHTSLFIA